MVSFTKQTNKPWNCINKCCGELSLLQRETSVDHKLGWLSSVKTALHSLKGPAVDSGTCPFQKGYASLKGFFACYIYEEHG